MSDPNLEIGNIIWTDLTVPDAEAIRDFYGAVAALIEPTTRI
jgi:predicted enzyme related to lactoylglutathione lyase